MCVAVAGYIGQRFANGVRQENLAALPFLPRRSLQRVRRKLSAGRTKARNPAHKPWGRFIRLVGIVLLPSVIPHPDRTCPAVQGPFERVHPICLPKKEMRLMLSALAFPDRGHQALPH